MKIDLTLKILKDVLEKTDVLEIKLVETEMHNYVEYGEDLEPLDKEFPKEFDIIILDNLSHGELQILDQNILAGYDGVEMRIANGHLEIFESEPESELEEKQQDD